MKSLPGLVVAAAFAALTCAVWAFLNRPAAEPPWPAHIQGFSFSPIRMGEDPTKHILPTDAEIDADLKLVTGKVGTVRTYSVAGSLADVPQLAARHGLNVAVGAWIDDHRDTNETQLQTAIELARTHLNVMRVFVGNEGALQGYVPIEELEGYLDRARAAIGQPVGTAEPPHVWLAHPELAEHCDFVGVHLLPYWEGFSVEEAVGYSLEQFHKLQKAFPNKQVIIAEVGWPSRGRTHVNAVASEANEALFLRRFLKRAEHDQIIYYLMEAFDQPWKADSEGSPGAYWGVYDVNRAPKFAFTAAIVRVPG